MTEPAKQKCEKTVVIFSIIAAFITLLVYLPALNNGFVNWDDPGYVYENPDIRAINLRFFKWAFADVVLGNWHPLTTLSYAIDYSIWGSNPLGYHLVNIVFHAADTFLVAILAASLVRFKNPEENGFNRAAFIGLITALLFGLHPLHVESVAWISERKDVLSVFFFLLSILAYLKYASISPKKYLHYIAALFAFALALMSKPMAVTLPIVLLILDFYPLERFFDGKGGFFRNALVEKLPFFILSAISAVLTLWAQRAGGAIASLETVPLKLRVFVGLRAYIFYLYKMILPVKLVPYYPLFVQTEVFNIEYTGSMVLLILITFLCILSIKRSGIYLSVWLYYLITLMPVAGFVQAGAQAAADRYAYIPSIGPFILASLGAVYALKKLAGRHAVAALVVVTFVTSAAMARATVRQTAVWKDSISLWSREIDVYPIIFGYTKRALAYQKEGRYKEAIDDYTVVIESPVQPRDLSNIYNDRGVAFQAIGNLSRAVKDYTEAIAVNPANVKAYNNRAEAYKTSGDYPAALKDYTAAISIDPMNITAYNNRANVYKILGNHRDAIKDYESALTLSPRNAVIYFNLALVYREMGDTGRTLDNLKKAADLGLKEAQELLSQR